MSFLLATRREFATSYESCSTYKKVLARREGMHALNTPQVRDISVIVLMRVLIQNQYMNRFNIVKINGIRSKAMIILNPWGREIFNWSCSKMVSRTFWSAKKIYKIQGNHLIATKNYSDNTTSTSPFLISNCTRHIKLCFTKNESANQPQSQLVLVLMVMMYLVRQLLI